MREGAAGHQRRHCLECTPAEGHPTDFEYAHMTWFTLWRGDTLLGRFAEHQTMRRHNERVGAAGLLESTDAFAGFLPIMQVRIPAFPGAPIHQSPIPIDHLGVADVPRAAATGPVPLKPMSEDEARGVPPEQVLVIRDAADNPVDADIVATWCVVLPDDVDLAEASRQYGVTLGSRQLWFVTFSRHDTLAT